MWAAAITITCARCAITITYALCAPLEPPSLVLPPLPLYTALLLSLKLLISLLKLIPSLALPLQLSITTTATSRLLLWTPILLSAQLLLPALLLLTLLDPNIDFIKIGHDENGMWIHLAAEFINFVKIFCSVWDVSSCRRGDGQNMLQEALRHSE